jgi:HlyD family secretion protein
MVCPVLTVHGVNHQVHAGELHVPDFRHQARKRRVVLALVVGLVAVALVVVLWPRRDATPPYRTAEVQRRNLTRVVEVSGRLEAPDRVEVPAPVAGRLVEIVATAGERVDAGDVLARLDEEGAVLAVRGGRAQAAAAESRVAQARAALGAVRATAERTERLAERGLASEADLAAARAAQEEAQAALRGAQAARAVAAADLEAAELMEAQREIRAPADGVVLEAPQRLGRLLGPEAGPLFVLGRTLDALLVEADVGEADVGHVRVGQTARFEVPAYPGRWFEARVTAVGLAGRRLEGATVYSAWLEADNPEHLLRPGMSATVRVEVGHVQDALSVPEAALRFVPPQAPEAPSRSRVWKVEDTELVAVQVRPGLMGGVHTEVRPDPEDALRPGDRVAVGVALAPDGNGPGIRLGGRGR